MSVGDCRGCHRGGKCLGGRDPLAGAKFFSIGVLVFKSSRAPGLVCEETFQEPYIRLAKLLFRVEGSRPTSHKCLSHRSMHSESSGGAKSPSA